MPKKITTQDFIESARQTHGDMYDYSLVEYKGATKKVTIVCLKHGEFTQLPGHHKKGHGCPKCAGRDGGDGTAGFVEKARKVHGDKYGYDKVVYKNAGSQVLIDCPIHGEFRQRATTHLQGHGCPSCAHDLNTKRGRLTSEEFIQNARARHKGKYDYSKVNYVNDRTKVTLVCPEHGDFDQTPNAHMQGKGCPSCGNTRKGRKPGGAALSQSTFIDRSRAMHGDKYDYAKSEYVNKTTKVIITCPEHGDFEQLPFNHFNGQGCPDCGGTKPLTTATFVEKARQVHGNRYLYDKTVFTKSNDKVIITCRVHGDFEQEANSHLQGHNCKLCGDVKTGRTLDYGARAETTRENMQALYGVDNPMQRPEIQTLHKNRLLELHGVENIAHVEGAQTRRRLTNFERYGASTYMGSDIGKQRYKEMSLATYGVENPMQNPEIADKAFMSRIANGSFGSSRGEAMLKEKLVAVFGEDDVVEQYKSEEYPFFCDFYIKSRDMRIELNAHQTHGFRWFDETDPACVARAQQLSGNMLEVWTERDVRKRECARKNNLNYVVFWSSDIHDADVWFAAGCPDAHDWEVEYSWLPDRHMLPQYGPVADIWNEACHVWHPGQRMRLDMLIYSKMLRFYNMASPFEATNYEVFAAMLDEGFA